MPESKARETFLPYAYGHQELVVSLANCALDGQATKVDWSQDSLECDLSGHAAWQHAELTFNLDPEPTGGWIPDYVPLLERSDPPVSLVAGVHCPKTFHRFQCLATLDLAGRKASAVVRLEKSLVRGSADISFHVVRTKPQDSDPKCATDAGARLMSSRVVGVRVDESSLKGGPGLKVEWESFSSSSHKYRSAHRGALFHMDLDAPDQPTLFLNSDSDPDLTAVLKEKAPGGRRAAVRNALFAAIGIPVWGCLLRAALLTVGDDGEVVGPSWERNVLVHVARVAEPGCADDEALRRLVRDLKRPETLRAMEQRLPVILGELVELRERAEGMVGVIR